MIAGLNIPSYTASIGAELMNELIDRTVQGIRVDLANDGDLGPVVGDFINAPVRPLFLLHSAARNEALLDSALPALGPGGFDLEVFNEPTGRRGPQTGVGDMVTFQDYIAGILAVHHDARARGFTGRIFAGAPANIGPDCWGWLVNTMGLVPPDVDLAFHRYSYKTQDDRSRPWPPFSSRLAELDALRRIADGRAIACTEFGYHTAEETKGMLWWAQTMRLTDDQALDNLVADLRLYEVGGVDAAFVYSINDGEQDAFMARFGMRRWPDWEWKPQARCFAEWRT